MVLMKLWAPMVSQNHGHICTDEIEARFTMNDPNGSRFPINTHHVFIHSSHLNLIQPL
ncbi:hypothetical protein Hanom_Chr12g01136791 [Helianthus anomalus]